MWWSPDPRFVLFPDKLKVIHALSRDTQPSHRPNVVVGRVTAELIREHIPDPTAVEVFACGPGLTRWDKQRAAEAGEEPTPRFLESVSDALANLGIPKDRVHLESYG